MKRDIPFDQAIALARGAQKLNCDTAEQLHSMVAKRVKEADRLRKTIERLRNALKPFASIALERDFEAKAEDRISGPDLSITPSEIRAARAALAKQS